MKKSGDLWVVKSAHCIQLAVRMRNGVTPLRGSERGEMNVLNDFLGNFHSHSSIRNKNDANVCMSDEDIERVKDCRGIEVIVALRKTSRKARARSNEWTASGYIDEGEGLYRFDVGGYYFDGRLYRARIEVPRRILRKFV